MAMKVEPKEPGLQEQLAKIRRDMAEINQRQVQTLYEPWKLALGGVIAGFVLCAASALFTKLFL